MYIILIYSDISTFSFISFWLFRAQNSLLNPVPLAWNQVGVATKDVSVWVVYLTRKWSVAPT